jgi:hypothetical protein
VNPTRSGFNLMSDHPINDPKHWLDRAKEARALAGQMNDPEAKRTMLGIAEDYERLAKRAEERAAGRWRENNEIRGCHDGMTALLARICGVPDSASAVSSSSRQTNTGRRGDRCCSIFSMRLSSPVRFLMGTAPPQSWLAARVNSHTSS